MHILFLFTLILGALAGPEDDTCIPMQSLTALTFTPGQIATRRRTASVLTMQCQGDCPPQAQIQAVQCTNTGTNDMGRVQWKCEANISPRIFQLASVHVQCEGCTGPGDTDVTRGSCQLQYSLTRAAGTSSRSYRSSDSSDIDTFILVILVLGVVLITCIGCGLCTRSTVQTSSNVAYGVPVGAAPNVAYGGGYAYPGYGYGGGSGLGTGMLMGYMMGEMAHGGGYSHYGRHYDDGGYGGGYDYGGGSGGGDWGGSVSYGDSSSI